MVARDDADVKCAFCRMGRNSRIARPAVAFWPPAQCSNFKGLYGQTLKEKQSCNGRASKVAFLPGAQNGRSSIGFALIERPRSHVHLQACPGRTSKVPFNVHGQECYDRASKVAWSNGWTFKVTFSPPDVQLSNDKACSLIWNRAIVWRGALWLTSVATWPNLMVARQGIDPALVERNGHQQRQPGSDGRT